MKQSYDSLAPFLSDWAERVSTDPARNRLDRPYRVSEDLMPAPGEPWPFTVSLAVDDKPVVLTCDGADEMRFIDWLRTLGPYQAKGQSEI